jgi:uncharacterized membrane protein
MEGEGSIELERRERAIARGENPAESSLGELSHEERIFSAQYRSHSGPLPSQEWFAAVEEIHPGATELILRDFAEERRHQREMQEKALDLDALHVRGFGRYQAHRLWIAGVLAFFVLVCGLVLILLDKTVYGFTLLVGEITTLAGLFLTQRLLPIDNEGFESDEEAH